MSETDAAPQARMFQADGDEHELRAARGPGADSAVHDDGVRAPAGTSAAAAAATAEQITFEQGYEELKAIVARLDDPDLPVHEMFDGFRRGKGLEQALRAYLQEREGELAELQDGKDLVAFEIVAPSGASAGG